MRLKTIVMNVCTIYILNGEINTEYVSYTTMDFLIQTFV